MFETTDVHGAMQGRLGLASSRLEQILGKNISSLRFEALLYPLQPNVDGQVGGLISAVGARVSAPQLLPIGIGEDAECKLLEFWTDFRRSAAIKWRLRIVFNRNIWTAEQDFSGG
jgi:hypothetical protein